MSLSSPFLLFSVSFHPLFRPYLYTFHFLLIPLSYLIPHPSLFLLYTSPIPFFLLFPHSPFLFLTFFPILHKYLPHTYPSFPIYFSLPSLLLFSSLLYLLFPTHILLSLVYSLSPTPSLSFSIHILPSPYPFLSKSHFTLSFSIQIPLSPSLSKILHSTYPSLFKILPSPYPSSHLSPLPPVNTQKGKYFFRSKGLPSPFASV